LPTRPEDRPPAHSRPGLATFAAAAALLALVVWRYGPILLSLETSFADFQALHGDLLLTEGADSRLNAWILDWVQRTAFTSPAHLLDANAFYPARGTLTGSEHLFGVALQTLPLRPFVTGAVGLHQVALVLSALALAATSFLGVRSLTGSDAAGFVAGVAAVMMPWRVTEISHLQLSCVQWFPAIWILLIRASYRDVGVGERTLLGVCVALQLLSSFYLAYFLTLSSALLLALTALGDPTRRRRLPGIAVSLAPGYVAFGLSALPYLARRAATELAPTIDPAFSIGFARVVELLHPRVPTWLQNPPPLLLSPDAVYDVPAGVLALALAAGLAATSRRFFVPELRAGVASLWAIVGLGGVLMVGGSLAVGDWEVPLPAQWLSVLLPGFEMLRGLSRWGILVGTALPLLAGAGVAALQSIPHPAGRAAATLAAFGALAASLDWYAIPARPAWSSPEASARRYAALAALPPGPVVEVPFSRPFDNPRLGARAMLASTLHRQPLVNGYTGYAPRSHRLLQRLGARLPQREAIAQFGRLTGARYFVVDVRESAPHNLAAWERHERQGLVQRRFGDGGARIYELRASAANGSGMPALLAATPGPTTVTGLPRSPLDLPSEAGSLSARIPARLLAGVDNPVSFDIHNASAVDWPSLDVYPEGLVLLRYTWRPLEAAEAAQTRLAPLDRDLAAGQRFIGQISLAAPLREGPLQLCVDLVQRRGDALARLPIRPLVRRVVLTRPVGLGGLAELIAASTQQPSLAACEPDPPASS